MANDLAEADGVAGLKYPLEELRDVMRLHYAKIIDFITSQPFQSIMELMSSLPPLGRAKFVQEVLLNDEMLGSRGVVIPEGILLQRSAFGDRRPTLFAVKHFLPDGYRDVWENVNITVDDEYVDSAVSRERTSCWRPPLSPSEQAEAMAGGQALADT